MSDQINPQSQNLDPFRNFRSENEGFLYRMVVQFLRRWQRRKAIATLDQLDDWTLDDIGLCRGQIPGVVDEIIGSDVRPAAFQEAMRGAGRRPGLCD